MANSKSAKKRILVAERNRVRNQAVKTRVKTMAKKVLYNYIRILIFLQEKKELKTPFAFWVNLIKENLLKN